MSKSSREFELAVHRFVQGLDPSARVLFDHRVLDRDTGRFRQVDVWVEARHRGHWPMSILVSCKKYRRRVDAGHIGTFINEVQSYGATTGVMYSSSGFTAPALEKAKAHGLPCCRLYRNEPADIPEVLIVPSYVCIPQLSISFCHGVEMQRYATWGELFKFRVGDPDSERPLLDVLAEGFHANEDSSIEQSTRKRHFPKPWLFHYTFSTARDGPTDLKIAVGGQWRIFRGKIEGHLVDGSYCFTDGSFHGRQSSPSVDLWSSHPGEGWEEVTSELPEMAPGIVMMVLSRGKFKQAAEKKLGKLPFLRSGNA